MTQQDPKPAGLVVVDKAGGMTSHDVVARVRRLAGTRKVGHAGTLDPMATGVLVLGVNRATRLLGHLMLTEKGYLATIRLGATTSTDDAEGEPLVAADPASVAALVDDQIRASLSRFEGEIDQIPSAVSAIKVDGKRAYQRVRDGEQVELAPRRVTVHELRVDEIRRPGDVPAVDVDVLVRCSSGTYIRSLARDLGAGLGVGGHLTALRRTAVGPFTLEQAATLDELADEFVMLDLDRAARQLFPGADLTLEQSTDVRYGRALADLELGSLTAVFDPDGRFLALYEPSEDGPGARAAAVFV